MKRLYIKKRFSASSAMIITQANDIIFEYKNQGFNLTLRQLYYQFVSRDIIPNSQKEYKRLGSIINDARLAGLIDWSDIEDRTREMQKNSHWTSPESILAAVAEQFAFDRRIDQPFYIEVWIEKDALSGVISGICSELDVPYFSCRGYTSQSEMHAAAMRFVDNQVNYDREGFVLHLGDHDPSGIDMTRDIEERLNIFYKSHCLENGIEDSISVLRLALNMDQIQQYNPPPNPAKSEDSRFRDYVKKYGKKSWELDALEPSVIVELIRSHVLALTDMAAFNSWVKEEAQEKARLNYIKNNYKKIVSRIKN